MFQNVYSLLNELANQKSSIEITGRGVITLDQLNRIDQCIKSMEDCIGNVKDILYCVLLKKKILPNNKKPVYVVAHCHEYTNPVDKLLWVIPNEGLMAIIMDSPRRVGSFISPSSATQCHPKIKQKLLVGKFKTKEENVQAFNSKKLRDAQIKNITRSLSHIEIPA